jgi:membrane protein
VKARLQAWAEEVQSWLPVRVLMAFGESQAGNYASAVAFNALLSMFPLIVGVLAIIGLGVRDPATLAKVQTVILQAFPNPAVQHELQQTLSGIKQAAGWLGLVAIGGLIWTASGIFASMEFAFSQIFGTPRRDLIRQKLMGIVMMFVLIPALFVTVVANTLAAYLPGSWLISTLIGSLVMMALLVLLYRLVPNHSYRIRDVLPGALLAGVLIALLALMFPLYTRFFGGANAYGASFAFFFLLATWFYLLSTLILLGAVYNKFRLGRPMKEGLLGSPTAETRPVRKPADVINEERIKHTATRRTPLPARMGAYLFVGLAMLARRGRRRGKRGIET